VNDLEDENEVAAGVYIQPIAVSLKFYKRNTSSEDEEENPGKSELFTASFDITERAEANAVYSDVLGRLLWRGNAQFAGQRIGLGTISGDGFWHREYALGVALPVWSNSLFSLRVGGRVKLIQGIMAVQTDKLNLVMDTDVNGEQVDLDVDYNVNTSLPDFDDDDLTFSEVYQTRGFGAGVDFGATLTFMKHFSASLSFLDLGSVNYNTENTNYARTASTNFEGVEISTDGTVENVDNLSDAIWEDIEPIETDESFSIGLPSRMVLQLEYNMYRKDKKEVEFAKHAAFLTYTQGFKDFGIASLTPMLNIAYTYSPNARFSIGNNFGFGGINGFALGPYLSVQGGAFSFGLGFNNLLGLISQQSARGADFALSLGLNFR
ncbi:MAG: DUF5723 family protein, partial [Bacteroidota bacterium]